MEELKEKRKRVKEERIREGVRKEGERTNSPRISITLAVICQTQCALQAV